ncbi:MAG: 7-cyano-7-deazaguanine synthase QueC [candidate division KSB1 bacterium]|nr:7-cyano-7-deazaguanine synthase QueC [candidate division KSB1 bacterium]
MTRKAVVLLSGGIDSTTTLAIARNQGFEIYAISFQYGQRHQRELEAARAVAAFLGVIRHLVVAVDLRAIGGSALTSELAVPKSRDIQAISAAIPVTYVPARNIIFLSIALAWAETIAARDIFIGANVVDYSGYPDCRPEFIAAYETMANLGTRAGAEGQPFKIHAPLIRMTKADIIRTGHHLGVDYSLTFSCYDPLPNGKPCGACDSCQWRQKGFQEAGIADPLLS